MFNFQVKIAENNQEIQQAMNLRYQVFKQEMGSSSDKGAADQLDRDKYDRFCDHLIVIDKEKNKTVGTYRLILSSGVDKKIGFYSENFFDITNIKQLANHCRVLELGRSCVHKDYRSKMVINLLWNGIAEYIKNYKVRYLFGSTRLLTNQPIEVSKIYKYLKERFFVEPKFRVNPLEKNRFDALNEDIEINHPRDILTHLPPLLKGYLRAGVLVCGPPAVNRDLNVVLIFILLDVARIARPYKRHYLKDVDL
jgi:putative hemolysin